MRTFRVILAVVVVALIFGAIKFLFLTTDSKPNAGLGKGQASKIPTNVKIVEAEKIELSYNISSTGSISAKEEVMLVPEIAGKVTELNIVEGGRVRKGQLLVKINDNDLQAQLKKLSLQARITQERVHRARKLLEINGISQEDHDILVNTYNTVESDMEFTKAQIAKTEIRAPFNGTIGLKYISEGSYVQNSTRIASVQQLDQIKIDFSIPEQYANSILVGTMINFQVSKNSKVFSARIYAIEPRIDKATRTIQLRAVTENVRDLMPGAFAKITVPMKSIPNAVMIPTEAIIPILKGKKVFLCKGGRAVERVVETGIRTDKSIQIVSGVEQGDSVVTAGFVQLKNGFPIKVIN